MKIKKIDKLKYARFNDFTWDSSVSNFSDTVNILFGWNGSGKTTYSNVIRMLESGVIDSSCGFKISTDTLEITELKNLEASKGNIRVFNKTFIEETLRGSDNIPYIFFAGKEAVSYEEEEKKLQDKTDNYFKIGLPTKHDDIAQRTAIIIKEVAGINSISKELTGAGTYASYNKTDFEKRISNIEKQISKGTITSYGDLKRQDIEDLKNQLLNTDILIKNDKQISVVVQWLLDNKENINKVLESQPLQVHSKRIDSLSDVQQVWVERGVKIHFESEDALKQCLFCSSSINNSDELIKHFSKEVVNALDLIDGYLKKVEAFSTEFARLDALTQKQRKSITYLRTILDSLTTSLQEKRDAISTKKAIFVLDTQKITNLSKQNEIDAASTAYAIESHFVAQQYNEYIREKDAYKKALSDKKTLKAEIDALENKVKTLKQKVKNTHEPAKALNNLFKTVFPYRKIEITDSNDGQGYVLKRDGSNCAFTTLSEGEKNFIALAYFIYSINDSQNKLADNGVVLIDDPVSSLDKQSIFQIFSIIVSEINRNSSRQYFVLTHNLDFFGHLREHYRNMIKKDEVRLFNFSATNTGCVINTIHPLLRDHRSDYYYVFDVLSQHKDSCDEEDAYLVVNLLRRWLETFLEFKFSTSGDLKSTLEMAYSIAAKQTEKHSNPFTANYLEMYRFINHGSHGFADTESIDDSILSGAQSRINEAFRLVETLDKLHYKKLQSIVTH